MLTEKEKRIHEQGLVSVLGQLHDELDVAVLAAYGWSDLVPALVGKPGGTTPCPDRSPRQAEAEATLLQRLVSLNAERAVEEQRGLVRWLRPEFQDPDGTRLRQGGQEEIQTRQPVAKLSKPGWPKTIPAQVQAVREALAKQPIPTGAEQLARQFKRARTERVREVLETLSDLGQAQVTEDGRYVI